MKILVTLLTLISITYARIDTTQNFFPLAVGNVWQYMYNDGTLEKIYVHSLVTDSLGYKYYSSNYGKYKVNPTRDSVFRILGGGYPDWLIYKFPITYPGQIWIVEQLPYGYFYAYVFQIGYISIFNRIVKSVDIRYHGGADTIWNNQEWDHTEFLADGIGVYWWGWEVEYKTLIGCVINGDTLGIIVNVDEEKENILDKFELYQNYPNPFNSATTISFTILREEFVELSVYNCLGEKIKVLKSELLKPGNCTLKFEASGLSTGTYFYRLLTPKGSITKKMLYIK